VHALVSTRQKQLMTSYAAVAAEHTLTQLTLVQLTNFES